MGTNKPPMTEVEALREASSYYESEVNRLAAEIAEQRRRYDSLLDYSQRNMRTLAEQLASRDMTISHARFSAHRLKEAWETGDMRLVGECIKELSETKGFKIRVIE